MRVSLEWLADYVAIDVPVVKLKDLLDLSGTKVETVHRPGDAIADVVVAEVLAISEHPNADSLTLVEVVAGGGSTSRVVCGARNFAVGDRVPLARVGARLPGMEVTERKIRGEVSRGMLCSGAELGISKDHSGILILPAEAEVGADVASVLGLDDTILELEVTPNRPDCLGMIGVAREVAALLGTDLIVPDSTLAEVEGPAPVRVEVRDPAGCPRYLARYIDELEVAPSPAWLARRLLAAGVRPIANIVDVTNYVMLEFGQPLHAFDAERVTDRHIVVRRAARNERMAFLDGVERALDRADLMIADPHGSLALAGVMGGEGSEVTERTTAVILESAWFDPVSIAYTTRRHQLRTEASARFERGVDPEAIGHAAERAAALLSDVAGGRSAHAVTDFYPQPATPVRIRLRSERTARVLGLDLSADAQATHLRSVGLAVTDVAGELQLEVPTFRRDLRLEEDLIEEVARLAGFELLPSTVPPGGSGGLDRDQRAERDVKLVLAAAGLSEAWTPSLSSPHDLDALGLGDDHPARSMVRLANPMAEEESAMRTTILPHLLRAAARNVARRAPGVALFEVARLYEPAGDALPREATVVTAVLGGVRDLETWRGPPRAWDFFSAKAVLESMCAALGLSGLVYSWASGMPFHPTRAARVSLGSTEVGALGELHPDVCRRFEVPGSTAAFEVALAPLVAALPGKVEIEEPPRHPAALLDVAVVVDERVPAGEVEGVIRAAGAPELASVRLFDVYAGTQVPAGRKSLAYALELRRAGATLTDEEALAVRDRIVGALAERVGGELRT